MSDGEFVPILVAGFIAMVLMYGFFVVLPNAHLGSPSGHVLATAEDSHMHTVLAEDKWVSSSLFSIAKTEGFVKDEFNGGEGGILLPFETGTDWFDRGVVEFSVKEGEGDLVMLINGEEIYRGYTKPGKHHANFDKESLTGEDVFEIRASRGLAFWSSAYYDVKAELKGEVFSIINTTFLTPTKYKSAKLIAAFGSSEGKLTVKINDQIVYEGEPETMINIDLDRLKKANRIEFLPDVGAKHLVDWAEIRFEK